MSEPTTPQVSVTLTDTADAEFAAWLAQQSDEIRAMTEAEQLEVWAEPWRQEPTRNPWEGMPRRHTCRPG